MSVALSISDAPSSDSDFPILVFISYLPLNLSAEHFQPWSRWNANLVCFNGRQRIALRTKWPYGEGCSIRRSLRYRRKELTKVKSGADYRSGKTAPEGSFLSVRNSSPHWK